jgi:hypothetical protein
MTFLFVVWDSAVGNAQREADTIFRTEVYCSCPCPSSLLWPEANLSTPPPEPRRETDTTAVINPHPFTAKSGKSIAARKTPEEDSGNQSGEHPEAFTPATPDLNLAVHDPYPFSLFRTRVVG